VTLSRHRNEITILTQDKQQLEKILLKIDGKQMSASELQGYKAIDISSPKHNYNMR